MLFISFSGIDCFRSVLSRDKEGISSSVYVAVLIKGISIELNRVEKIDGL